MTSQTSIKIEYDLKYSKFRLKCSKHFVRQINFIGRIIKTNKQKMRILDLGGGTGEYSVMLQEMGHDVTLLDISEVAVRKAKELGVKKVHCGDLLSFSHDELFDMILVKGFSMLNTNDVLKFEKTLKVIYSHLSCDGYILYWDNSNLTGKWGASGWYNHRISDLTKLFDSTFIFLAFRYQTFLPLFISNIISKILCTRNKLNRPLTIIGILRRK